VTDQTKPIGTIENLGTPIALENIEFCGISAEAVPKEKSQVKVWTRLAITSHDPEFHDIAEGISSSLLHIAQQVGFCPALDRTNNVLLVIRPDKSGELWLDNAAITMNVLPKRDIHPGTVVLQNDVADVVGMSFPKVEIGSEDGIVCLFREGWSFGLYFDFNPNKNLNVSEFERALGTLYRRLKYRKTYDVIADLPFFLRLVEFGWFPFVEIMGGEFDELANVFANDLDIRACEQRLIDRFNTARLNQMFKRWMTKPHIAGKKDILSSAIRAFESNDPIACIKITLTEIEGILNDHHRSLHGRGAKLDKLMQHIVSVAEKKAGSATTLFLPDAFAKYLKEYVYAQTNPSDPAPDAGSRHAVGHGSAKAEAYTQTRALQALLTLDQIAFYS